MPAETWANYEQRWRVLSPRMKAYLEKLVAQFPGSDLWENKGDDYSWSMIVPRPDGNKLDVSFELIDAHDASGDHEAGVRGALALNLVEEGGLIVGGLTPNNYGDDLWIPYRDAKQFDERLSLMERADAAPTIREWLGRSKEKLVCQECGEPMFIESDGVSHHGTPDEIDYDADADHVALAEE